MMPSPDENVPVEGSEQVVVDEYNKDRWDEGGASDCGYSDSVHETLMSIGGFMHGIFGEPTEGLQRKMKGIGSYFQEAAYAARDLKRGDLDKKEFRFKTDDLEVEEGESGAEVSDEEVFDSGEEEEVI